MTAVLPVLLVGLLSSGPPITRAEDLSMLLSDEMNLLEALDKLDKDKTSQEEALAENKTRKEQVLKRLSIAQQGHEEARDKLHQKRVVIKKRLGAYLKLQKMAEWQVLASAKEYNTYARRQRLLQQLIADDEARIRAHHSTVSAYRKAKAAHEHELDALRSVEKQINKAKKNLARDIAVKKALLESVRNDKAYFKKANHDLDKAAQALQQQINTFEAWKRKRSWFRNAKGQFAIPLQGGRVARGFGKKTHPRFKTVTMHRGVEIVPHRGKSPAVRTIFTGKVVYAGWLRGYGNTVIIDHTQNDYTLYGHLKKLLVKVDQIVDTRQNIGIMGSSGSLSGERLYFELRINGEPTNPAGWFHRY